MNKRNKIIISIVGITIVLLALLGITYAYYLTRIEGNTNSNSISVTTADLKVSYGENSSEVIVKENALPGEMLAEKSFTITNDGTGSAEFSIILDNIENSFQRNLDLKYILNSQLKYGRYFTQSLACFNKIHYLCIGFIHQHAI